MKSTNNLLIALLLLMTSITPSMARDAEKEHFLSTLFKGRDYPVALTQSPSYPWTVDYNTVKTTCRQDDVNSDCWFSLDMYVPADSATVTFDYQVRYHKESFGWAKYANLICSVDGEEVFRNNGTDKTETATIKVGQGHHCVKWNLRLGEAWENWDYFGMIENMRIEGISNEVALAEYSKNESWQWTFPSEKSTDTIKIENIGQETLQISGIEGLSSPFHIQSSVTSVAPGSAAALVISFEPQEDGCFEQTLNLMSNTGKKRIPLHGISYETTPVCLTDPGKLSEVAYDTNVEALSIFGPMSRADHYHLSKLKKLKYLDLRGTDTEYIFNGGVNNLYELEEILLPSSLKYIDATWFWKHYAGRYQPDEYYAIKTITCLSPDPPQLIFMGGGEENYTFGGLRDEVVVYVPAPYLPFYTTDPKWGKFKIMALSDDSKSIKATFDSKTVQDYEGCSLALEDKLTGRSQRLTIGSVSEYVFHNIKPDRYYKVQLLHTSKQVLASKDSITVGENKSVAVSFDTIVPLHTATLQVLDIDGADVTASVHAVWSVSGRGTMTGNSVTGLLKGDSITCFVKLPKSLGYTYHVPDTLFHTVTDGGNLLQATLRPLEKHHLRGRITDLGNKPLASATLTVSQSIADNLNWDKVYRPDEEGLFDIQVYQGVVKLEIACDKYFTNIITSDTICGDVDMGYIMLSPCVGRKITLDVTYQYNAPRGTEGYLSKGYDDWKNLVLSVYDADTKEEIADAKAEYPYIYLDGLETEKPNLAIRLSHRNHLFNEMEVPSTPSGDGNFTAVMRIVEYGDLKVTTQAAPDMKTKVLLYDTDNQFVRTGYFANGSVTFKGLPDGAYQIVAIEDNGLYSHISDYTQFETLGLSKGKDYAYASVEMASGMVEEIVFPGIPELNTSLHIASDRTRLSPSKSHVAAGNYLTVKSLIEIKPDYVGKIGNLSLNVLIPDSSEFVRQSLLIGSELASFNIKDRTVEIPIDENADEIRFCILPKKGGEMNVNAYLSYEMEGNPFKESIGGFVADVTGVSLNVMPTVASTEVKVSGSGPANSEVEIIEDNLLVGRAKVLANGRWQTTITLCDDRDLKTHHIHARITTPDRQLLYSESQSVRMHRMRPYVKKIEMFNATPRQYTTVFDFSNPFDTKPSYSYSSSYPDFTFKVWFDNVSDPASVHDAVLWVKTSDGKDVSVQLVESPDDPNIMIGSHAFRSSYSLPTNVAIVLNYIDDSVLQPQNVIDILSEAMPSADAVGILHSEENEGVSFELASTRGTFSLLCGSVIYSPGDAMSAKVDGAINRFRFEPVLGDEHFFISPEEGVLWKEELADSRVRASLLYDALSGDEFRAVMSFLDQELGRKSPARVQLDDNFRLVPNPSQFRLSHKMDKSMQELIDICNKKLDCVEKNGETDLEFAARDIKATLDNMTGLNLSMAVAIMSGTHEMAMNAPRGQSVVENAMNADDLVNSTANTVIAIEGISASLRKHIQNLNRYPTECGLSSKPDYVGTGVSPLIDPSGYVYEAVASNRLEGVKATAYFKTSTTDDNGETVEEVSVWDASMYEQENPLLTDSEGRYAWDVPAGLWQVKYEKSGYEPAESEWLPVPPPQMDVNIGMKQLVNPVVSYAKAYADSIAFGFSKYMDVNTLDEQNIIVLSDGQPVGGRLEMVNEESCDGHHYASRLMFVPSEPLAVGHPVSLSISSKVRSYAGCPLSDDFAGILTVEPAIVLNIPETVEMAVGDTVLIKIRTNAPELSGQSIHVKIDGEAFVSSLQKEVALDGQEAYIELAGLLPGKALATISLDGYRVSGAATVVVSNNLMKQVYAPWATIETGTTVERGTVVYLYSATPNARIYYTTDDSCPCSQSSRMVYDANEGITIDTDVTIKAYAESENMMDSEVTELRYKVNLTTGTVSADVAHGVKITPVILTPENDCVTISFENASQASFELFDLYGTKVSEGKVKSGEAVSFAEHLKGVYILSVAVDSLRLSEKIVKSF